jgi:preprotein translocase subunit SecF
MAAAGTGTRGGLLRRLYRGDTNFNFIGARRRWYIASGLIIAICVISMLTRGFNIGIEFKGGDSYQLPVRPGVTLADVRGAVDKAGIEVSSAQTVGTGANRNFVIRTPNSDASVRAKVAADLVTVGKLSSANDVTATTVSGSWGGEVTSQALWALGWFLVAVAVFIWLRFQEWRMATAALLALLHDLLLTAGVYSLVGFEVTPSTVVGLLTILGFSLYDTVVVFDKVSENARGLLSSTRMTYPEAANAAVNQTLMRSINTSIIGLLPVAGLLFVGAGLLGVGTLEDLALVLFVGMMTGAYSSLFLATPWLVDFKLMDPRYRNQQQRVLSRRAQLRRDAEEGPTGRRAAAARSSAARRSAAGTAATSTEPPTEPRTEPADTEAVADTRPSAYAAATGGSGATGPRVGAKPGPKRGGQRPNRPGAKRR